MKLQRSWNFNNEVLNESVRDHFKVGIPRLSLSNSFGSNLHHDKYYASITYSVFCEDAVYSQGEIAGDVDPVINYARISESVQRTQAGLIWWIQLSSGLNPGDLDLTLKQWTTKMTKRIQRNKAPRNSFVLLIFSVDFFLSFR